MAGLVEVKNITNGPKGAYAEGALFMAEAGEVIIADDYSDEWFEVVKAEKPKAESKPAKADVKDA